MKYMMNVFIFIASLLISLNVSAADGGGGVTCGPGNVSQEPAPSGGTCKDHSERIKESCSENPSFLQGQQQQGTVPQVTGNEANSPAVLQTAKTGIGTGANSCRNMGRALGQCRSAGDACKKVCDEEIKKHNDLGTQYSSNAMTASQAPPEFQKAQEKTEMKGTCATEVARSEKKMGSSMQDIAQLLQALSGLISALGGNGDAANDLVKAEDEEEDKCDGPNASLILECSGQSDPIGSRAGVSGQTGVGDLSDGAGQSLFGQAAEGDPGGDSDGAAKAAGTGFQNNGLGAGFGNSGFPGTGVSAASADKDKLNADIYKGYMGGGGSGGIGSYGGGGGGGRSGTSGSTPFRPASSNHKRLQSALDKVASAGGRNPASIDSTNGPYQNIWGVVTKTYKKTSPSMFHKE